MISIIVRRQAAQSTFRPLTSKHCDTSFVAVYKTRVAWGLQYLFLITGTMDDGIQVLCRHAWLLLKVDFFHSVPDLRLHEGSTWCVAIVGEQH